MLDPKTGEVLVMASTPTYDAGAIADPTTARAAFKAVSNDPAKPLLDRAIQGRYVPGSVFKIVTSIAALGSGRDHAGHDLRPRSRRPRRTACSSPASGSATGTTCSPGSTPLAFQKAIEVSCNIYFALTGLATGGDALASWAAKLGFGAPIPFDLPTATSQVTNGGGSFGGGFADDVELANAAYGQGETLATPLQMALVASSVANHGVLMKPRLVTGVSGADGSTTYGPEVWRTVMSPEVAAEIGSAMVSAVEGDDGRQFTAGAQVPGVVVAGKSGTAQLDGSAKPHSWFVGYAPAERSPGRDRGHRRVRREWLGQGLADRRPDARQVPGHGRPMTDEPDHGSAGPPDQPAGAAPRRRTPAREPAGAGRSTVPAEAAHRAPRDGASSPWCSRRSSGSSGWPPSRLGEPFLGVMGVVGCLMTLWVGGITLFRR